MTKRAAWMLLTGVAACPTAVSTANADLSVTNIEFPVTVSGGALAPGYDRQDYGSGKTLTSLGESASFSGAAISHLTQASSSAFGATAARIDGFSVVQDTTGSAHLRDSGGGCSADAVTELTVTFTLSAAGPLWIGGTAIATVSLRPHDQMEMQLTGPSGGLFHYNRISSGPNIYYYTPFAAAGIYTLFSRANAGAGDAGGGGSTGGDGHAHAEFIVATVPGPGTAGVLLVAACGAARRRRR